MSKVRVYDHFINGEWVKPQQEERIERHYPATGELIAKFANGTVEETEKAIAAARKAFNGEWPKWTARERSRLLLEISNRLRKDVDRLAKIESEEVGKPINLARGDVMGAADHFEYAAAMTRDLVGETNFLNQNLSAIVVREPIGVVGLITPWNFPIGILCQKLPYALASGNTVVIKPSEFTSSTTLELAAIAHEAGMPPGVINVVTGYGNVVGNALVSSHDVDKVSFTGSTVTGRKILEASAGNLKKVSLELGGKSPSIVFPEADMERTVDGVLHAICFMQGECCVAGSRLLVSQEIHDEFVQRLVEKAKQLVIGDPSDPKTEIGPMIHQQHMEKVLNYIQVGIDEGAKLETGGSRYLEKPCDAGYFVEPTIFTDVDNSMTIARDEIFGPVLSVISFKDEEEAIAIANDTQYGLAASIWTQDIDQAFRVAKAVRAGTIWINGHLDAYPELPFGGYKASGLDREMGRYGIESFTEVKTIQFHHAND